MTAPHATPPASGLRRFRSAPPPAAERCELCGTALPDEHRHLVDTERRSLACACRSCAVLLPHGRTDGRFRAVPERRLTDPGLTVSGTGWRALGVPVGIVFYFRNSALGRLVACYPGPAGVTEADVDTAAWEAVFGGSPLVRALLPDVEALLVRWTGERADCALVPVDTAYALAGRLRSHWHGFDGGSRARAEVDAFFAEIAARAAEVGQ